MENSSLKIKGLLNLITIENIARTELKRLNSKKFTVLSMDGCLQTFNNKFNQYYGDSDIIPILVLGKEYNRRPDAWDAYLVESLVSKKSDNYLALEISYPTEQLTENLGLHSKLNLTDAKILQKMIQANLAEYVLRLHELSSSVRLFFIS
jgi:hypothetical protein